MSEFLLHILSIIVSGVVITLIVLFINRMDRKRHGEYHITSEYKFFKFYYQDVKNMMEALDSLGKEGWEIATCIGDDSFYSYLILKRETLQQQRNECPTILR